MWVDWEWFRNDSENLVIHVPLKTPQQMDEVELFVSNIYQMACNNMSINTKIYNENNNIYPLEVGELLIQKGKLIKRT